MKAGRPVTLILMDDRIYTQNLGPRCTRIEQSSQEPYCGDWGDGQPPKRQLKKWQNFVHPFILVKASSGNLSLIAREILKKVARRRLVSGASANRVG